MGDGESGAFGSAVDSGGEVGAGGEDGGVSVFSLEPLDNGVGFFVGEGGSGGEDHVFFSVVSQASAFEGELEASDAVLGVGGVGVAADEEDSFVAEVEEMVGGEGSSETVVAVDA